MSYDTASESTATTAAVQRLQSYMNNGKMEGVALFKAIRDNVITPYRVYTKDMYFAPALKAGEPPRYDVLIDGNVSPFQLHRHALGQMASEVKIPITFVNTLMNGADWEWVELSDLLDERFKKLDFKQRGGGLPRFINLVVGDQVRGFVSRSFKRYLRSGPIFEAFVKSCANFGAMPVEALRSDLSFTLRCMLPHVFELERNKHIAIGISCSNSDFGAGVFKIGLTVMSLQTGAITYLYSIKEERHVGSAEKDGGQSEVLSDETIEKKIVATQSEVRDVVASGLHPDKVNELLENIRLSMSKEISWHKFVSYMQGKLTSEEIKELQELLKDSKKSQEIADIQYDVDDQAIINLWWASNALATVAKKYEGDKRDELQCAAGNVLVSGKSWA